MTIARAAHLTDCVAGVPVVHVRGEVVEKQQGNSSVPTKAPVGEPDVSDLDEPCASRLVRIIRRKHVLPERFQRHRCIRACGRPKSVQAATAERVDVPEIVGKMLPPLGSLQWPQGSKF